MYSFCSRYEHTTSSRYLDVRGSQTTAANSSSNGRLSPSQFTSHSLMVQAHLSGTLPAELGWASLMATVETFDTGYPGLGARALLINPLLAALATLQPILMHEWVAAALEACSKLQTETHLKLPHLPIWPLPVRSEHQPPPQSLLLPHLCHPQSFQHWHQPQLWQWQPCSSVGFS